MCENHDFVMNSKQTKRRSLNSVRVRNHLECRPHSDILISCLFDVESDIP